MKTKARTNPAGPPLYVYFLQSAEGDVKIGCGADPWERLKDLQTGQPRKLTMLAIIHGDFETERKLHRFFRNVRLTGGGKEWFQGEPVRLWLLSVEHLFVDVPRRKPRRRGDPDRPNWKFPKKK